jgi:hypothetical protein
MSQARAPCGDTWRWAALPVRWVRPARTWRWGWLAIGAKPNPRTTWGYQVLGLPCLCAGSDPYAWLETLARPKAHGSDVRTQYYWVLQHDSVLLGSVLGPKANGSCVRTRTHTHPPWVQPQTQTQPSWVRPRTPPTWSEHRPNLIGFRRVPNPLGSGHGPKPLRSTPGRT